jgi:hypothetical protein
VFFGLSLLRIFSYPNQEGKYFSIVADMVQKVSWRKLFNYDCQHLDDLDEEAFVTQQLTITKFLVDEHPELPASVLLRIKFEAEKCLNKSLDELRGEQFTKFFLVLCTFESNRHESKFKHHVLLLEIAP